MSKTSRRRRSYYIPWGCVIPLVLGVAALVAWIVVPLSAARTYGPPDESLGGWQRFQYSLALLWYDGLVTRPVDSSAGERPFSIAQGEQAAEVAERLEQAGLVRSAAAFRAYLIYRGMDTSLQAGDYSLSPALAPLQIAERLQDATPSQVKFVVLPGWRMEEIAASLSTSGLKITPDEFLAEARRAHPNFDSVPPDASAEGFLLPDEYILPRAIRARQVIDLLMSRFELALTSELRNGFSKQGLNIYQAVTLASIIQREAVESDEQPIIASVMLNRLATGMKLQTDPTIQYALGLNPANGSWWKSPLSLDDLATNSAYNTYTHSGLPPGPISNPSLSALQAVAFPAKTSYLFFRARCDGSGRHAFTETFEQHLANECP